MNPVAALRRRVQAAHAAYKPRSRRNRAGKMKKLRVEIEEARRASVSPTASPSPKSLEVDGSTEDNKSTSLGEIIDSVGGENARPGRDPTLCGPESALDSVVASERQQGSPASSQLLKDTANAGAGSSKETLVDEQAVQDYRYIRFFGEDADDYTYGPSRIILASDGVRPCAALLLTLDFSAKVQKVLLAEREYAKLQKSAQRRREAASRFEARVMREIASHQYRLRALERSDQSDAEKEASLREEIHILEQMLEESKSDRQRTMNLVLERATTLREMQARANVYLEEAFVCARLVEAKVDEPESPVQERDLQKEYEAFRRNMSGAGSTSNVPPLDISRDHFRASPLTPEQQARQDLVEAYWEAHELLQDAQNAFDAKGERRAAEWHMNAEAEARGETPMDATQEEFDLRWLKAGQELTHKLLRAEEAFAAAKANARQAGIDMSTGDQISVSVDDEEGRQSFDEECVVAASEPKITTWLTSLSNPLSPNYNESTAEEDEWESRDVDIGDSISVVAEGADRKRIDEWRRACMDSMSHK